MATRADYEREFADEARLEYPDLDRYEQWAGFKLGKGRMEQAARVLACPVKKNPPSWQHGRLLYASLRRYLVWWELTEENKRGAEPRCILDIGTAKGFSALVMLWAVTDSVYLPGAFPIFSVDVIDPLGRVPRNTVAEVDGPLTLGEILQPWSEAKAVTFLKSSGRDWLRGHKGRVCFAFIDGKHNYQEVNVELTLLANLQKAGDIVVLDDIQIEGVAQALTQFRHAYEWQLVHATPADEITAARSRAPRTYAVARRRV